MLLLPHWSSNSHKSLKVSARRKVLLALPTKSNNGNKIYSSPSNLKSAVWKRFGFYMKDVKFSELPRPVRTF